MTDDPRDVLLSLLRQTQPSEMDCDAFLDAIAEFADTGDLGDTQPLFDHHRRICPDCEEELEALLRALS